MQEQINIRELVKSIWFRVVTICDITAVASGSDSSAGGLPGKPTSCAV